MPCFSLCFFLVAYCFFYGTYAADDLKATVYAIEKCGTSKYNFDMAFSDSMFSGNLDLTDEINNENAVELVFYNEMGGEWAEMVSASYDNIKEPLDKVAKAWEKVRGAANPKIVEPYTIPAGKYEIKDFFLTSADCNVPINQKGNLMVDVKLFSPDTQELACIQMKMKIE